MARSARRTAPAVALSARCGDTPVTSTAPATARKTTRMSTPSSPTSRLVA